MRVLLQISMSAVPAYSSCLNTGTSRYANGCGSRLNDSDWVVL